MRRNIEIDDLIFEKWDNGMTIKELSQVEFDCALSLKTIRNIVYRFRSEHEQKIYSLFRIKFLELQDIDKAIKFVHENQPKFTVSEKTIRRILDEKLRKQHSPTSPKNLKNKKII